MSKTFLKPLIVNDSYLDIDWDIPQLYEVVITNNGSVVCMKVEENYSNKSIVVDDNHILILSEEDSSLVFDEESGSLRLPDNTEFKINTITDKPLKGISSYSGLQISLDKEAAAIGDTIEISVDSITRGNIDDIIEYIVYVYDSETNSTIPITTSTERTIEVTMNLTGSGGTAMYLGVKGIASNGESTSITIARPVSVIIDSHPVLLDGFLKKTEFDERNELILEFDLYKIVNNISTKGDLKLSVYAPDYVDYADLVYNPSEERYLYINGEELKTVDTAKLYNIYTPITLSFDSVMTDRDFKLYIAIIDPLHENYDDPTTYEYVEFIITVKDKSVPPDLSFIVAYFNSISEGKNNTVGQNGDLDPLLRDEVGSTAYLSYVHTFAHPDITVSTIGSFSDSVTVDTTQLDILANLPTNVTLTVNDNYSGKSSSVTLPVIVSADVIIPTSNITIAKVTESETFYSGDVIEFDIVSTGNVFDSGSGTMRVYFDSDVGGDMTFDSIIYSRHYLDLVIDNTAFSQKLYVTVGDDIGEMVVSITAKDSNQLEFTKLGSSLPIVIDEYSTVDIDNIEIEFISNGGTVFTGTKDNPLLLDTYSETDGSTVSDIRTIVVKNIVGGVNPITVTSEANFNTTVLDSSSNNVKSVTDSRVEFDISNVDIREISSISDTFDPEFYIFKDSIKFNIVDARNVTKELVKDFYYKKSNINRFESSPLYESLDIDYTIDINSIENKVANYLFNLTINDNSEITNPFFYKLSLWSDSSQSLGDIYISNGGRKVYLDNGDSLAFNSSNVNNELTFALNVESVTELERGDSTNIYLSIYSVTMINGNEHGVITFIPIEYKSTESLINSTNATVSITNKPLEDDQHLWINYKNNYYLNIEGIILEETGESIDYTRATILLEDNYNDLYTTSESPTNTVISNTNRIESSLLIDNPISDRPYTLSIQVIYENVTVDLTVLLDYRVFSFPSITSYNIYTTDLLPFSNILIPSDDDNVHELVIYDESVNGDPIGHHKYIDDLHIVLSTQDTSDPVFVGDSFYKSSGTLVPTFTPAKHNFSIRVNTSTNFHNASIDWTLTATNKVTADVVVLNRTDSFTLSTEDSDIEYDNSYLEFQTNSDSSINIDNGVIRYDMYDSFTLQLKGLNSKTGGTIDPTLISVDYDTVEELNMSVTLEDKLLTVNNILINDGGEEFVSGNPKPIPIVLSNPKVTVEDRNSITSVNTFINFVYESIGYATVSLEHFNYLFINRLNFFKSGETEFSTINSDVENRYFSFGTHENEHSLVEPIQLNPLYFNQIVITLSSPSINFNDDPSHQSSYVEYDNELDYFNDNVFVYSFDSGITDPTDTTWYDEFKQPFDFTINSDKLLADYPNTSKLYFKAKVELIRDDGTTYTSFPDSGIVFNLDAYREDRTKPVITLLGEPYINISEGGEYIEPGYTATDNVDGNIVDQVVINSELDVNVPNEYIIRYNVVDAAGNNANEVIRRVKVNPYDTVKPIITLIGDNEIQLTQGDTYEELGASVRDDVDGLISEVLVVDSSSVDTSTPGRYFVTYNAQDSSGNNAVEITRTIVVNRSDTTPPTITLLGSNPVQMYVGDTYNELGYTANDDVDGDITDSVIIDTSNILTTSANTTSYVTYTVTDASGNDTIETRTVHVLEAVDANPVITLIGEGSVNILQGNTYNDAGATAVDDNDGDITSDIVVTSNVDVNKVGVYTVKYNVTDSNNNSAIEVVRIVNVELVDNTPPTITLTGDNPQIINIGDTYTESGATATDNVDGDITDSIVIDSSQVNVNVRGNYKVSYTVTDNNDNDAVEERDVIVRDNEAPVITLSGDNPIEFTVGDNYVESGYTAVDNLEGDVSANVTINLENLDMDTVGSYNVIYTVSDEDDNEHVVTRVVNVVEVVDTTDPVITLTGDNPLTLNQGDTYTDPGFSATDDIDGDITDSVVVNGTVDTNTVGSYTITYTVTDSANNSHEVSRVVNVVDSEAPVITLTGDNPLTMRYGDSYVEPGFTATDNIDGDVATQVLVDTSELTNAVTSTEPYKVYYSVVDNNNNSFTIEREVYIINTFDIYTDTTNSLKVSNNPLDIKDQLKHAIPINFENSLDTIDDSTLVLDIKMKFTDIDGTVKDLVEPYTISLVSSDFNHITVENSVITVDGSSIDLPDVTNTPTLKKITLRFDPVDTDYEFTNNEQEYSVYLIRPSYRPFSDLVSSNFSLLEPTSDLSTMFSIFSHPIDTGVDTSYSTINIKDNTSVSRTPITSTPSGLTLSSLDTSGVKVVGNKYFSTYDTVEIIHSETVIDSMVNRPLFIAVTLDLSDFNSVQYQNAINITANNGADIINILRITTSSALVDSNSFKINNFTNNYSESVNDIFSLFIYSTDHESSVHTVKLYDHSNGVFHNMNSVDIKLKDYNSLTPLSTNVGDTVDIAVEIGSLPSTNLTVIYDAVVKATITDEYLLPFVDAYHIYDTPSFKLDNVRHLPNIDETELTDENYDSTVKLEFYDNNNTLHHSIVGLNMSSKVYEDSINDLSVFNNTMIVKYNVTEQVRKNYEYTETYTILDNVADTVPVLEFDVSYNDTDFDTLYAGDPNSYSINVDVSNITHSGESSYSLSFDINNSSSNFTTKTNWTLEHVEGTTLDLNNLSFNVLITDKLSSFTDENIVIDITMTDDTDDRYTTVKSIVIPIKEYNFDVTPITDGMNLTILSNGTELFTNTSPNHAVVLDKTLMVDNTVFEIDLTHVVDNEYYNNFRIIAGDASLTLPINRTGELFEPTYNETYTEISDSLSVVELNTVLNPVNYSVEIGNNQPINIWLEVVNSIDNNDVTYIKLADYLPHSISTSANVASGITIDDIEFYESGVFVPYNQVESTTNILDHNKFKYDRIPSNFPITLIMENPKLTTLVKWDFTSFTLGESKLVIDSTEIDITSRLLTNGWMALDVNTDFNLNRYYQTLDGEINLYFVNAEQQYDRAISSKITVDLRFVSSFNYLRTIFPYYHIGESEEASIDYTSPLLMLDGDNNLHGGYFIDNTFNNENTIQNSVKLWFNPNLVNEELLRTFFIVNDNSIKIQIIESDVSFNLNIDSIDGVYTKSIVNDLLPVLENSFDIEFDYDIGNDDNLKKIKVVFSVQIRNHNSQPTTFYSHIFTIAVRQTNAVIRPVPTTGFVSDGDSATGSITLNSEGNLVINSDSNIESFNFNINDDGDLIVQSDTEDTNKFTVETGKLKFDDS